uniref:Pacifastin domain-containing protein n=2 Tax=Clastoptera arizonana TaxID=38151 RepID=A0A1B6CG74_9HEMI
MGYTSWFLLVVVFHCTGAVRLPHTLSPCRVAGGKTVAHGGQIEREDPCERCLCLDGSMFCWWGQQHCTNSSFDVVATENITESENVSSWSEDMYETDDTSSAANVTEIIVPTHITKCTVMGKEYHEGEVLPRDTGTCLECVCGPEGRVTCNPKDCVHPSEDFHNPDPNNSLDMFDVDVF